MRALIQFNHDRSFRHASSIPNALIKEEPLELNYNQKSNKSLKCNYCLYTGYIEQDSRGKKADQQRRLNNQRQRAQTNAKNQYKNYSKR